MCPHQGTSHSGPHSWSHTWHTIWHSSRQFKSMELDSLRDLATMSRHYIVGIIIRLTSEIQLSPDWPMTIHVIRSPLEDARIVSGRFIGCFHDLACTNFREMLIIIIILILSTVRLCPKAFFPSHLQCMLNGRDSFLHVTQKLIRWARPWWLDFIWAMPLLGMYNGAANTERGPYVQMFCHRSGQLCLWINCQPSIAS